MSAPSVLRAVRSGRLLKSLVYDAAGKAKIADVAQADAEWAANTDLTKAPAAVKARAPRRTAPEPPADGNDEPEDLPPLPAGMVGSLSLSEASALAQEWRAKVLELDYREKCGELVDAKDLESRLVDVFAQCKTKLLGLTSKAKSAIPKLTHADVLVLDGMIREALEDLAASHVVDGELRIGGAG